MILNYKNTFIIEIKTEIYQKLKSHIITLFYPIILLPRRNHK